MVILKLEQIIGRIDQEEGDMLFALARKPHHQLLEERKLVSGSMPKRLVKFFPFQKRNPEVAGVHFGGRVNLIRIQMADDLVAEKVECHPVMIPPGKGAPQFFIKINRFIKVLARNRKVKHFVCFAHKKASSNKVQTRSLYNLSGRNTLK